MQRRNLSRIKEYGGKLLERGIVDPTKYSDCKEEDIMGAKKAIREGRKDMGEQEKIEMGFLKKGIDISLTERTVGVEISRTDGPKGEKIRFFGETQGYKHNYGSYTGKIDLIAINPTMCAREARKGMTEKVDQFERLERRINAVRGRREVVDGIVLGAMRKTKTSNLEDHRLMADFLEQIGVLYLGREMDELAKHRGPGEVFEELVQRNMNITALHEIRHREDHRWKRQKNPPEVEELLAYLMELSSSHTTLGILQLPVNRNRLKSQNANQRGAELLLKELSAYFGVYGIRDKTELKRRVNDMLEFDQIIFRRAAQAILEKMATEGKYRMSDEEVKEIEKITFLEGRVKDYVFGI